MKLITSYLLLPFLLLSNCIAQAEEGKKKDAPVTENAPVAILPFGFFTPETSVSLGGAVVYYFRAEGSTHEAKPSRLAATAFFSLKSQYRFQLSPKFYINNEDYFLDIKVWFSQWPDDFFGIGNDTKDSDEETFTTQFFKVRLSFQKRIYEKFYAGLIGIYTTTDIIEKESGGLIDRKLFRGSDGGNNVGIGWILVNDTRDNIITPTTGAYDQISALYYSDALGSDFNFNSYIFDLRRYFTVNGDNVIAFQAYANRIGGNPPFDELAKLGGLNRMRGYFRGRFRDQNYYTAQVEYRMPVWWRFGVVGFAGMGDVSESIGGFQLKDIKYSIGFGLRYMILKDENANVRMDFGFGETGIGFYVDFAETF